MGRDRRYDNSPNYEGPYRHRGAPSGNSYTLWGILAGILGLLLFFIL